MVARLFAAKAFVFALTLALVAAQAQSADAQTVQYTYDALGRVVTVTYSNGAVITYTYDAAGNRITVVQAPPPPQP